MPALSLEERTLVLAAFPAEADAVLSHTILDPSPVVTVGRRHYYLGAIGAKKVIVAMTGIGMVNATDTTQAALARFAAVDAVVFSGVAGGGGHVRIADVAIPARWTPDSGKTLRPVDPGLLSAAEAVSVALASAGGRMVRLRHQPRVVTGGDGCSYDNHNGRAFPGIPNGGSVFGCQPRTAPNRSRRYTGNFFEAAWPWLRHGLVGNMSIALAGDPAFDATDNETAAAQAVADARGVPFLAVRGISDGVGDPLRLPGFPFQFFVYNRIAARNAARVTAAFLRSRA
ncbi:hypothetical protein [Mycobacterium shigaense]|uniref:5'-methylthioadenosine/S-adenosylhomocysteine nucleosidase family protein n=1 Tax=Mycobacterium shigaense TaxID=722731 RepID=UPI001F088BD7|nr:hypothetical protein [Mycobacterium shigaense]